MAEQIIRLPEVTKITGLAKSTIYKLVNEKRFPAQIKLTNFSSGWIKSEVEMWVDERINISRK